MSLKINLYAEFLLNIRQVTIFATLQNDRTEESIAYVTSDKKSLTVVHDTESATITFPSGISGKATVNFPVARSKTVSLRLEIIEDDKPAHDLGVGIDNDSPWPASSLGQETDIACRSCEEIIVAARSRVWKDLPREDWAEMMDLWHCHKPTTKDPPSQEQSTKGYAATNKLRARPGVGFVDTCHVVVTKEECTSIKDTDDLQIICANCNAPLGVLDDAYEGVRLYKWSLLVRRTSNSNWERNLVQSFICAQLLGLIESQALRKFIAYSGKLEDTSHGILLWVFTPELKYCASSLSNGRPRRAMKVLFEVIENPRGILEKNTSTTEELPLPVSILARLQADLEASNRMMPDAAQTLQNWRVGLLDRFDLREPPTTKSTVMAPGLFPNPN